VDPVIPPVKFFGYGGYWYHQLRAHGVDAVKAMHLANDAGLDDAADPIGAKERAQREIAEILYGTDMPSRCPGLLGYLYTHTDDCLQYVAHGHYEKIPFWMRLFDFLRGCGWRSKRWIPGLLDVWPQNKGDRPMRKNIIPIAVLVAAAFIVLAVLADVLTDDPESKSITYTHSVIENLRIDVDSKPGVRIWETPADTVNKTPKTLDSMAIVLTDSRIMVIHFVEADPDED
jgi:hypothetical protein